MKRYWPMLLRGWLNGMSGAVYQDQDAQGHRKEDQPGRADDMHEGRPGVVPPGLPAPQFCGLNAEMPLLR